MGRGEVRGGVRGGGGVDIAGIGVCGGVEWKWGEARGRGNCIGGVAAVEELLGQLGDFGGAGGWRGSGLGTRTDGRGGGMGWVERERGAGSRGWGEVLESFWEVRERCREVPGD